MLLQVDELGAELVVTVTVEFTVIVAVLVVMLIDVLVAVVVIVVVLITLVAMQVAVLVAMLVSVLVAVLVVVGAQEQAELYREGSVPQRAVRLEGKPVVAVITVAVKVEQKAMPRGRLAVGKTARRQLGF